MKKKTLRTMTTLMSTVVIGSSLFAGCSSKNESTSTSVEDNSIAVSPTKEATTVPVKEVTTVPTEEATITPSKEATQEPTKNANGMQETSDSTNSDVSVTFESIDEIIKDEENSDVVLIELSYNRPVITIANNEAASKKINDYFAKLYEENQATMEEYKADAKELYKEREIRSEWRGYEIGMNYSLERADENCISFECSFYCDYTYLHPTYWECGYTFNTSTGELLTLEDISSDLDTFQSKVNDRVVEYCKQREKEYGTRIFYEGYEDDIPNILQDNTWFFDEKGFELIVNEYTIAPHVLGSFYVLIPYQELVGVKEEFIKK